MKYCRRILGFQLQRAASVLMFGVAASVASLGFAVALEGCSDSTGGQRVVLHTRMGLEPSAREGFTTAAGWHVTLTRALTVAGPFYYYDGAPPLALRDAASRGRFAQRWLGLGSAAAHPQHYKFGNVRGQMEAVTSVDLLGEIADLPEGEGVSGTYRSARFSFRPEPVGPAAAELGSHAVVAEGRAEKDGAEPRFFRAVTDVADLNRSIVEGHVDGCAFAEADIQSDGTVTVLVHPKPWFNLVDFSKLEPGSAEEPSEFPAGSQPKVAFSQGVAQLSAYKLSYVADEKVGP
jgi:hypothetical protein